MFNHVELEIKSQRKLEPEEEANLRAGLGRSGVEVKNLTFDEERGSITVVGVLDENQVVQAIRQNLTNLLPVPEAAVQVGTAFEVVNFEGIPGIGKLQKTHQ